MVADLHRLSHLAYVWCSWGFQFEVSSELSSYDYIFQLTGSKDYVEDFPAIDWVGNW
jgi:hypothetical protein